jgi:hypothetical protein
MLNCSPVPEPPFDAQATVVSIKNLKAAARGFLSDSRRVLEAMSRRYRDQGGLSLGMSIRYFAGSHRTLTKVRIQAESM